MLGTETCRDPSRNDYRLYTKIKAAPSTISAPTVNSDAAERFCLDAVGMMLSSRYSLWRRSEDRLPRAIGSAPNVRRLKAYSISPGLAPAWCTFHRYVAGSAKRGRPFREAGQRSPAYSP